MQLNAGRPNFLKSLTERQLGYRKKISISSIETGTPDTGESKHWVENLDYEGSFDVKFFVRAVYFDSKGKLCFGVGGFGIHVWNWLTKQTICAVVFGKPIHIYDSKCLELKGGIHLISSYKEIVSGRRVMNYVHVHDERVYIKELANEINKLAVNNFAPTVFLSMGLKEIKTYDLRMDDRSQITILNRESIACNACFYNIEFNPRHPSEFCVTTNVNKILIYDLRNMRSYKEEYSTIENDIDPCSISFSTDGTEILASHGTYLYICKRHTMQTPGEKLISDIIGKSMDGGAQFLGVNSEYVACGTRENSVLIYEKSTKKYVHELQHDWRFCPPAIARHPEEPFIYTLNGMSSFVDVWRPCNFKEKPFMFNLDKANLLPKKRNCVV